MKKNTFRRYLREMTQGSRVALCKILPEGLTVRPCSGTEQIVSSHKCLQQHLPKHLAQFKTIFFFLNYIILAKTPAN